MAINWLAVCIGLIICCGGIYLKKTVSALIGASFGGILGVILAIVTAATMYEIDDKLFLYMIVCAVIFAIFCAVYDRLCSAIVTFIVSFVTLIIWLLFASEIEAIRMLILIASVVSFILSYIAYLLDTLSFILITAFGGALIANIGFYGLIHHMELVDTIISMTWGYFDGFAEIFIGTGILGSIGCYVQYQRRKKQKDNVTEKDSKLKKEQIQEKKSQIEKIAKRLENIIKKDLILCFLVVPCLAYIVFPYIVGHFKWERDIYLVLLKTQNFLMVASVAILGYYVLTQDMKYNILYQIPYLISEIGKKSFGTAIYRIFGIVKFPLTGLVLLVIAGSGISKKRKPFIVAGAAYACYYVIIPSLVGFFSGSGYAFYISRHVIPIVEMYIVSYFMYKCLQRKNIFEIFNDISFTQIGIFIKNKVINNKRLKYIILVLCMIGIFCELVLVVKDRIVSHNAKLDLSNPIIKELLDDNVQLQEFEQYQLDLDMDGTDEVLYFYIDFVKAFGHRVFININDKDYELENFGEDYQDGAYETNALHAQVELCLDSDDKIYIRVYTPSEYGAEECEIEYRENKLFARNKSVDVYSWE